MAARCAQVHSGSGGSSMADLLDGPLHEEGGGAGPLLDLPRNQSSPNLAAASLPTSSAAFDPFGELSSGGLSGSLSSQNLRAGTGRPVNAAATRGGPAGFSGSAISGSQNLLGDLSIYLDVPTRLVGFLNWYRYRTAEPRF
jgi:hypothetical protein